MEETIKIIRKYLDLYPNDGGGLNVLTKQLESSTDFFNRKNFTGHIVANALVINNGKILTIFHNKLQMHLQPGGHVDNEDMSVIDAAIREVAEETGLVDIILNEWHNKSGIPICIESHQIPESVERQEKEHYHHDFMYIFETETDDVKLQLEEVSAFEWVDIEYILENDRDSFIGKSLKKAFKLRII